MVLDMSEEAPEQETLHLRATVADITVEVEGPIAEAETWFEALQEDYLPDVDPEELNAKSAQIGSQTENMDAGGESKNQKTSTNEKSKSLAEYYKLADNLIKKDAALVVGWYLEYHEDVQNFTPSEVEGRAKDAKINLGANVSRDLSSQVKEGRLHKDAERSGSDAYQLTITGEEYVKDELLELES